MPEGREPECKFVTVVAGDDGECGEKWQIRAVRITFNFQVWSKDRVLITS